MFDGNIKREKNHHEPRVQLRLHFHDRCFVNVSIFTIFITNLKNSYLAKIEFTQGP